MYPDNDNLPGKIGGFLGKFQMFQPVDRRVRMAIQSFLDTRLESTEVLKKDSIRCIGKTIYIHVNPYIKQELLGHSKEILALLADRDHLYFDSIR